LEEAISRGDVTGTNNNSLLFPSPFSEGRWNPQAAIEKRHHAAFLRHLERAKGLSLAASDHLARSDIASVYEGKDRQNLKAIHTRRSNCFCSVTIFSFYTSRLMRNKED
jgi:hypothetical protein